MYGYDGEMFRGNNFAAAGYAASTLTASLAMI